MQIKNTIALIAVLPTLAFGTPVIRGSEAALEVRATVPVPVTCAAPSVSLPNPNPVDCQTLTSKLPDGSSLTTGVSFTYNSCTITFSNTQAAIVAASTLKTASDAINSQCQTSAGVWGTSTTPGGAVTIAYSGKASTSDVLITGSVCGGV